NATVHSAISFLGNGHYTSDRNHRWNPVGKIFWSGFGETDQDNVYRKYVRSSFSCPATFAVDLRGSRAFDANIWCHQFAGELALYYHRYTYDRCSPRRKLDCFSISSATCDPSESFDCSGAVWVSDACS